MSIQTNVARVKALPLLALRGLVPFPGVMIHFDIGRERSMAALSQAMEEDQEIFLVMQRDAQIEEPSIDELHTVGVVAHVRQIMKLPKNGFRVVAEGEYRAVVTEVLESDPCLRVQVVEKRSRVPLDDAKREALSRLIHASFNEYAALSPNVPADAMDRMGQLREDLPTLCDHVAFYLPLLPEKKQTLLAQLLVATRAQTVLALLEKEKNVASLELELHDRVQERMDDNQRDYYLREQMRVIADELGDEDDPLHEAEDYRQKIAALELSDEVKTTLDKECKKLAKMPIGSQEATVVRTYLDTCLDLPWNTKTEDDTDLKRAREILERDHYGLSDVKDRIMELLAVRRRNPEAKGQVVCLVGPPGVGKTSIAKSVAEAMGRKFARVSLGGVRDEAEIRGHRRTYIGSMPGRIMAAVAKSGSKNPLLLLDEVDKMGSDHRGDPASALLEVLDFEQNHAFVDHYIDLPFDISDVMFLTTANDASAIPAPLYDRMDVITLDGYTEQEKLHIAKGYLVKKQLKAAGMEGTKLRFSDAVLKALMEGYTREAGVRNLERAIGKVCRKMALKAENGESVSLSVKTLKPLLGPCPYKPDRLPEKDEIGAVNGLAWTSAGGELLPIEVAVLPGTGKIELTGSLGDVMKESAKIAVSVCRANAEKYGIDGEFYKTKDIHIHAPEGAVPKDGPSAGITMTTALVSALTGVPVRRDMAMTGEISLRGNVLPIGGLKEKLMAAYARKMTTVLIPSDNLPDLEKVDAEVREGLTIKPVSHIDDVLALALTRPLKARKIAGNRESHTAKPALQQRMKGTRV